MKHSERKTMRAERAGMLAAAAAVALAVCASQTAAAGLLIADGGLGGVLVIEEHTARVTINNGIAVTEVTQIFRNTEQREVEALYTFPVPKGASVADFSMWIKGTEMIGEVVEKKRAREIYESYKPKRIDPGLLEQTDYKHFEMRIFPIGPGARQKVRIAYYQELEVDHDWATYVYPLATAAKGGVDAKTTGKFALTLHVKSQVPIVSMESPSHGSAFVTKQFSQTYWQASMETTGGDLSKDVVLAYHLVRPKTGIDLIASRQKGEDGYFCLTLTAGEELGGEQPGMDYVFILDVSGSMALDGKLGLSRRTIGAFIDALEEKDRFEIVTFNIVANALFEKLTVADRQATLAAGEHMASQKARGGTVLRHALSAAYKYAEAGRALNVVILSDGMTDQGERATLLEMIRSRPPGARVFCVGVGNEVNRPLLAQLARDAGGLASFLSRQDSFERQAKAFRRKLTRPAASNVRIELAGVKVHDLEPVELPNLYHGAPVRMYGRYVGGGKVQVTLRAKMSGAEIEKSAEMVFPDVDAENPQIDRMWAWHRIQRLLAEADRTGSRDQVAAEVVQLGEAYSVATEYTSFIVLENDGEYQRWKIARRNALRVERDRASQRQLHSELEAMQQRVVSRLGPKMAEPIEGGPVLASPVKPKPALKPPPSPPGHFGGGGGPVGPIVAAVVAGLVAVECRRRRKGRSCKR